MIYKRRKNKTLIFPDYDNFRPNLTPDEMFKMGSFGGTYFRPITSGITKKKYRNVHKKYIFLSNISEQKLTSENYDKSINKYNVKVGTTLEQWEEKGWITKTDPYGWVQWYCEFYNGRRIQKEDEIQISRWLGVTGEKGRFLKWLVKIIQEKNGKWDDESISPRIRQTLQHWGYALTKCDFDNLVSQQIESPDNRKTSSMDFLA
jgi:hypothetical protein